MQTQEQLNTYNNVANKLTEQHTHIRVFQKLRVHCQQC